MPEQPENVERLTAACILSIVGGFLDIYTYLYRGRVFANAVTGNMVLFGLNLAELQWRACSKYLLAILFYALGVLAAEYIHRKFQEPRQISWHQSVLLLEVGCLLPVIFVPYGEFDFAVNALISFVCALQAQTFRRVNGLPFVSTMCTGNLRSGTEAFFHKISGVPSATWHKALHYYLVIGCFITGAVAGAFLLKHFGHLIFFLAPAGLLAVFIFVISCRQRVLLRQVRRKLFGARGSKLPK